MSENQETDLTERQQQILKVIIGEYINSGQPIGSKTLVDNYKLGVSPATVRNEMVLLEEGGYLFQPHTSAGRVPTEKGYRYFVRKLMGDATLSHTEQLMIQHQFHQARLELDQWMRLSAAVLAHTTQSASLVTSPRVDHCKVKHIELISIHDHVALLILVLKEGTVKQQIINLEAPRTQDELRSISTQLTGLWSGGGVNTVSITAPTLTGLAARIAVVIIETMTRINARESSDMYHDGLVHLLEAELPRDDALEQIIRVLEEERVVNQLIGQALGQKGVQIIIGGEGKWDDLSRVSLVLARYGTHDGISGALGVVGPIRMPYVRAVSIVQYMSHLMSNLLGDLYGSQPS